MPIHLAGNATRIGVMAGALLVAPMAKALTIVADIPPVAALAQALAGPEDEVEILGGEGVDAHHFSLRPSQLRALSAADVVVAIGPSLSQAMFDAIAHAQPGQIMVLQDVEGIRLLEPRTGVPLSHPDESDAEHGDHDAHDHEDDAPYSEGHADFHGGIDAHMWLDVGNLKRFAEAIRDTLAAASPDQAEAYRERGAALIARLEAIEERLLQAEESGVQAARLYRHDAMQYFDDAYLAGPSAALTDHNDAPLRPQRVQAVEDFVEAHALTCMIADAATQGDFGELEIMRADVLGAEMDIEARTSLEDFFGGIVETAYRCASPVR